MTLGWSHEFAFVHRVSCWPPGPVVPSAKIENEIGISLG